MLYLRATTLQNNVVRISRAIPAVTVAMIYYVTFIESVAVPAMDGDRLVEVARFMRPSTVAPLDTRPAMAEVTIFWAESPRLILTSVILRNIWLVCEAM
ncbi:hypothetical protein IPdc08_00103 [archaeon]|nr:hypothetical protein IPdc08_00103 [archaeon]